MYIERDTYMCVLYVCVYMYMHTYIYIYREREINDNNNNPYNYKYSNNREHSAPCRTREAQSNVIARCMIAIT